MDLRRSSAFRRVAAVTFPLALWVLPPASHAGSIGFRIDVEVRSNPGVAATVTLTHTGDEAASNVRVTAELLDRSVTGELVRRLAPGDDHAWNLDLADDSIPEGAHAVVVRASYTDTNGYPFEVVSASPASLRVQPRQRLTGSVRVPKIPGQDEVSGVLTLRRPPARSGQFSARLVGPSGLRIRPETVPVQFDEGGTATAEFRVSNVKLLAGTTVNVYALVSEAGTDFPQTDSVRGTVRVVKAEPILTKELFYGGAVALTLLLGILEILVRLRRRS